MMRRTASQKSDASDFPSHHVPSHHMRQMTAPPQIDRSLQRASVKCTSPIENPNQEIAEQDTHKTRRAQNGKYSAGCTDSGSDTTQNSTPPSDPLE
jgi:hypothetical protein